MYFLLNMLIFHCCVRFQRGKTTPWKYTFFFLMQLSKYKFGSSAHVVSGIEGRWSLSCRPKRVWKTQRFFGTWTLGVSTTNVKPQKSLERSVFSNGSITRLLWISSGESRWFPMIFFRIFFTLWGVSWNPI